MRPLVCCALLLALGPGCKKKLDSGKLVASIKADLGKQLGVPFDSVDCPGDRSLKKGDTFVCTGKAAGLPIEVEIEQTSNEGDVHMRVRHIAIVKKLTDQIEAKFKDAGKDAKVDCGSAPLKAVKQGQSFDCSIVSGGETMAIVVTATDDYGGTHYEPKK